MSDAGAHALFAAVFALVLAASVYLVLLLDLRRRRAEQRLREANADLELRVAERTAALRDSESRYRQLARGLPNGAVMMFDRDHRYLMVEGAPAFLESMGTVSADLVGKSLAGQPGGHGSGLPGGPGRRGAHRRAAAR